MTRMYMYLAGLMPSRVSVRGGLRSFLVFREVHHSTWRLGRSLKLGVGRSLRPKLNSDGEFSAEIYWCFCVSKNSLRLTCLLTLL